MRVILNSFRPMPCASHPVNFCLAYPTIVETNGRRAAPGNALLRLELLGHHRVVHGDLVTLLDFRVLEAVHGELPNVSSLVDAERLGLGVDLLDLARELVLLRAGRDRYAGDQGQHGYEGDHCRHESGTHRSPVPCGRRRRPAHGVRTRSSLLRRVLLLRCPLLRYTVAGLEGLGFGHELSFLGLAVPAVSLDVEYPGLGVYPD